MEPIRKIFILGCALAATLQGIDAREVVAAFIAQQRRQSLRAVTRVVGDP
jgi:hypothetical protein